MLIYNQKKIVIVSFIISIIMLLGIHLILIIINEQKSNENHLQSQVVLTIAKPIEQQQTASNSSFIYQKTSNWRIQIPAIQLDAAIQEGTSNTVMRQAVGHFENTAYMNGNVCLAAHNRGYKYNFFQWIKNLKIGDKIIYQYNGEKKTYEVKTNARIQETDWTYLQESKENKITLITCAENMPEYRICVQAEEVKKGET